MSVQPSLECSGILWNRSSWSQSVLSDTELATIVIDMKVPVNRLAASFFAHLPVPEETRLVFSGTDWVRGTFAFRAGRHVRKDFREVFQAYYTQSIEKGVETAPHILFARCRDDADS